jgi:hypothetical protein
VLLVKIRVKLVDYKLFKALKYRAKTKGEENEILS